jgi:hypothetical protein
LLAVQVLALLGMAFCATVCVVAIVVKKKCESKKEVEYVLLSEDNSTGEPAQCEEDNSSNSIDSEYTISMNQISTPSDTSNNSTDADYTKSSDQISTPQVGSYEDTGNNSDYSISMEQISTPQSSSYEADSEYTIPMEKISTPQSSSYEGH